jgi:hypothetical protein
MADDDAALSEPILYVAEAEVETKVQPHRMSNDLRREPVASIGRVVGRRRSTPSSCTSRRGYTHTCRCPFGWTTTAACLARLVSAAPDPHFALEHRQALFEAHGHPSDDAPLS